MRCVSLTRADLVVDPFGFRDSQNIEQGGEIAKTNDVLRLRFDGGFGVVGDAEATGLQHGEVVRAVADGDGLFERDAEGGGMTFERGFLGLFAEDGELHRAGEAAVFGEENIGLVFVETGALLDGVGEEGEAAGNEDAMDAARA